MKDKKLSEFIFYIFDILLLTFCANCMWVIKATGKPSLIFFAVLAGLFVNLFPGHPRRWFPNFRLRVCYHGTACLITFFAASAVSVIFHIYAAFYLLPHEWKEWLLSAVICTLILAVVFWNGIISVYCTSVQLGIRHRVWGIICGMLPIANLFMLYLIIKVVSHEITLETEKARKNTARKDEEICKTKYPVLLVHGVFFRDFKLLNYWGRVPDELEKNGAQIFYGNHHSAASVSDCAEELTARIKEIVRETNCEKVNIIAHSKGGLDCRCAISECGAAPYVASLTTVNTPHRGCEFADYLLSKMPTELQQKIAVSYNAAMKALGDEHPDFIAAVHDLTAESCRAFNERTADTSPFKGIYCQSVGSKLNHAVSGKFPLNFTYPLVKYFDGPNDGLVSEKSFAWGDSYRFLTTKGKRGISHADMIDLNRENIPGFDVREFYVGLVADLKKKGL